MKNGCITRCCALACLLLLGVLTTVAQRPAFDLNLWSAGLPNGNGSTVEKPSMRVFLPDQRLATGRAVLALPGGGYSNLAIDHEGYGWAPFFNNQGIALIVVKYRMPHGNPDVPFSDVCQALQMVKDSAKAWNINPYDIGIMGSSAGGHLASTVATHAGSSLRPAFQILFYPVITMDQSYTHGGSRNNLIGNNPSPELVRQYSNELRVDAETPRAYIALSDDDDVVPPMNAINYYSALHRQQIPATLHIYPSGGHGWGMNKPSFPYHQQQQAELTAWLNAFKAPVKADAVRVACIGNSITYGDRIRNRKKDSYPAQLGTLLGEHYLVRNFGVNGATMLNKSDLPYMKTQAWKDARAFNPNIVVIKLGTNDSKPGNWVNKKNFTTDMQAMIDTLRALPSKPTIYLCSPARAFSNRFGIRDSVITTDIIPLVQKVAKKNHLQLIDLYAITKGHPEVFVDEIHPNEIGAGMLAKEIYRVLGETPKKQVRQ